MDITTLRIGHGFDAHAFIANKPLILGGVHLKHPLGLHAHSDGDVVIHALMDALLGAAALGDLGYYFPETDTIWRNANSRMLLRKIVTLLEEKKYWVHNVDITIMAHEPKIMPYRKRMCENLAEDITIEQEKISVKASSMNGLSFVGRNEGIAASATVLISKRDAACVTQLAS